MSIHFASSSCPCNAWQHFLMPLTAPSFQMWYFDHQGPMFVSFRGLYYFIIYTLVHSPHLILTHHKILHVRHIRATNLWGSVITYLIQLLLQFAWITVTEKSELKQSIIRYSRNRDEIKPNIIRNVIVKWIVYFPPYIFFHWLLRDAQRLPPVLWIFYKEKVRKNSSISACSNNILFNKSSECSALLLKIHRSFLWVYTWSSTGGKVTILKCCFQSIFFMVVLHQVLSECLIHWDIY